MLTKALARLGQSPLGFLALTLVAGVVAFGTYLAAGRSGANGASHPAYSLVRAQSSPQSVFGPAPNAAGFAKVLVAVSNDFAAQNHNPTRLSHAHCVEASRGHYMCAYLVSRPQHPNECHLMQAEWARERNSSFTVLLSGRARRCGSVREAIRSLS
jgi:hypothetical protein